MISLARVLPRLDLREEDSCREEAGEEANLRVALLRLGSEAVQIRAGRKQHKVPHLG